LYVLPPASPKYNVGVEKSNGIFRTEFYDSSRTFLKKIVQSILKAIYVSLFFSVKVFASWNPEHFAN
jgi:hypothetical protein